MRQPPERDASTRTKVCTKLLDVLAKGYFEEGVVTNLMPFFSVPKGTHDVRLVYDGSKSGLNSYLWAPWFPLPTITTLERSLVPGSVMGDLDIGEIFLNFLLHPRLRPYTGVDLRPFVLAADLPPDSDGLLRWTRMAMGLRLSPFICVLMFLLVQESLKKLEQWNSPGNLFRWDQVVMNCPGDPMFDPSMPWLYKWDARNSYLASDILAYIDDVRGAASGTQASSKMAAIIHYVTTHLHFKGVQVALRKWTVPGMRPGPWAGTISDTSAGVVRRGVSIERWQKCQALTANVVQLVEARGGLKGR